VSELLYKEGFKQRAAGAKVTPEQPSGEPVFSKEFYAALMDLELNRLVLHSGRS
jgi:hypothetical protein